MIYIFGNKLSTYFVGDDMNEMFLAEQLFTEKKMRFDITKVYGYSSTRPIVAAISFGKCNKIKRLYLQFCLRRDKIKGRLFTMGI